MEWLTVKEASEYVGRNRKSLYRFVNDLEMHKPEEVLVEAQQPKRVSRRAIDEHFGLAVNETAKAKPKEKATEEEWLSSAEVANLLGVRPMSASRIITRALQEFPELVYVHSPRVRFLAKSYINLKYPNGPHFNSGNRRYIFRKRKGNVQICHKGNVVAELSPSNVQALLKMTLK